MHVSKEPENTEGAVMLLWCIKLQEEAVQQHLPNFKARFPILGHDLPVRVFDLLLQTCFQISRPELLVKGTERLTDLKLLTDQCDVAHVHSPSSLIRSLQNISRQEFCVSRERGHFKGRFWIPSYQIPKGTSGPTCQGDGWERAGKNIDTGKCQYAKGRTKRC